MTKNLCLLKIGKKITEIKFAALIAEENIPFKTSESILSFFRDLGEDPEVLKSMTMNWNKAPKVIKNVLCVREQERLVEKLQNNKFSIFVDETSDSTNDKWMTFLVRYELLELIHLDASDCSVEKLFTNFRAEMWKKSYGEAWQDLLDRLNQEGHGEIVISIYDNCLAFYDIPTKEIRNKLFVKDKFLSKLRIFESKFVLQQEDEKNSPNNSVQDVLFAQRFGGFDEKILKEEWQFLKKDFTSEQKATIINLHFDESWKTIMATKKADGKFRYPVLIKLINAIRSLPNSNADAERVFSMLTDVKTKKRNKFHPSNVQSLCVFKSILRARGEMARTMIVDARHLALMSENLYKTNARENTCFLRLFGADKRPSTSSDL
ncbi:hypothetical protein ALC57_16158 [Trachymyrmex cornetzi]|uniref:HAT C-terminal dimerisation domain-containing protein n=1 Tax=Trachymyrmex cornetzi TaxID=471704 RepID=A0A151IVF6_9HYME|nr:hypothetical protein ALC57_16158 [Trachymyrmex cornetzi]